MRWALNARQVRARVFFDEGSTSRWPFCPIRPDGHWKVNESDELTFHCTHTVYFESSAGIEPSIGHLCLKTRIFLLL